MKQFKEDITILFAGDFIPPDVNAQIYSPELATVLQQKDFSIVNLEAPFTTTNNRISKTGLNFGLNPEGIQIIKQGFFNAVALSNNHIRDFGNQGVETTLSICRGNNISTVGAGLNVQEAEKPLKINIKGKKICFLNYSEHEFNIVSTRKAGANPFNIINAHNHIVEQKKNSDYVFVIYHGGLENHKLPPVNLVKRLKFLVDVGADGIIVHHSHNYSGLLFHKDKPIALGLGNFLLKVKSTKTKAWYNGLVLKFVLGNEGIGVELIPIEQSKDFSAIGIAQGEDKQRILNEIENLSAIINDSEQFEKYWEKENRKYSVQLLNLLKSNTRWEYRIRKRLGIIGKGLSTYKLNILLNLTRCQSHRERMIQILESLYNDKQTESES